MKTARRLMLIFGCMLLISPAVAEDWPQWMGPERDGVWRESGIVAKFPPDGPKKLWSVPVNAGYSGPAVANGRVFVMDRIAEDPEDARKAMTEGVPGEERILCFDAGTGESIWERKFEVLYKISYPAGPRATPLVDEGMVYCLGAMGHLHCLNATNGKTAWKKDFMKEFGMKDPLVWGWSAHPMIDGENLICLVGGKDAGVVAFNRKTGAEIWRSVNAKEIGYAPPVLHTSNDRRQLIVWHDVAVKGLDPATGKKLWNIPFPAYDGIQRPAVTIANPTLSGNRLFVSDFYNGSLMLELAEDKADAEELWSSPKDIGGHDDTINTLMGAAVMRDDHLYGFAGDGELRCLKVETGEVVWRDRKAAGGKKALFATIFIVPIGESGTRYFLYTDQGELIIANLSPEGYEEVARSKFLDATSFARGRDIVWSHPAFANRRMYARNDKELACFDLEKPADGG